MIAESRLDVTGQITAFRQEAAENGSHRDAVQVLRGLTPSARRNRKTCPHAEAWATCQARSTSGIATKPVGYHVIRALQNTNRTSLAEICVLKSFGRAL